MLKFKLSIQFTKRKEFRIVSLMQFFFRKYMLLVYKNCHFLCRIFFLFNITICIALTLTPNIIMVYYNKHSYFDHI